MNKFMKFLASPTGRFLIAAIVLSVVSYISWVMYNIAQQKKKYNGKTKSQVEDAIKKSVVQDNIQYLLENDTEVALQGAEAVLGWHDNNRPLLVEDFHVNNTLSQLGIMQEFTPDFNHLVGKQVLRMQYYS